MNPKPLTVVMYHYVRPISTSRYPRIRGLEMRDFGGQLDYLKRHYQSVTAAQVIQASRGEYELPDAPLLLTFDDGYRDHIDVFRVLKKRGMNGVFFPPASVVRERKVIDVNKLHFVLASVQDIQLLVGAIERTIISSKDKYALLPLTEYRNRYWQDNRFDPASVNYVKRMLQVGLPEELRAEIADDLFSKYVSSDAQAFANELYLSESDLKEMLAEGMEVGSHGYSHYWLNSLSLDQQSLDIDRSLEFLSSLGVCLRDFLFCYPYGGYSDETLELLTHRGCGAAFTTRVALANTLPENMLEIPRLDTKDLPVSGGSSIVNWTKQVKSQTREIPWNQQTL